MTVSRTVPRPPLVSLAVLALPLTLSVACASDSRPPPLEASLSGATGPQTEFRALRARFFDADAAGRASLAAELEGFLARNPKDERADDVRIYSAFALLERGERARARELIAPILHGPRGSQRDFARVAEAAILSREGETRRALAVFDALSGRIIDLDERFVYGEERARTAFLSGNYEVALTALLDWLVQSPPDRQVRARQTAAKLIGLVPTDDLLAALPGLRQVSGSRQDLASGREWLVDTIVTALTRAALERSASPLAQRLLEVAPAALRGTPDGRRLVELASSGLRAPSVAGRAVGLLLGIGTSLERRRATTVSEGMTRALGATKNRGDRRVELLVRYGTDDVPAAFSALTADGASLIVAGGDDESAARAAAQAETLGIPLLLLRALPSPPPEHGFTFVLGLDDRTVADALEEALAQRGAHHVERVGPGGFSCDVEPASPGRARFPLGTWKKTGVDALLVTGGEQCARDISTELSAGSLGWSMALGLDASAVLPELGARALAIETGSYPAKAPTGGWYEALGHDAAVLAALALEALPTNGVARGEDVEALRSRARDALATAKAELWTSSARGFGGARVLPRHLGVVLGEPAAP